MTRQAALLVQHGPVNQGAFKHLIHGLSVALAAGLEPTAGSRDGTRRSITFMTLTAHFFRHGAVHVILEQSRLIGSVGIVTDGAGR